MTVPGRKSIFSISTSVEPMGRNWPQSSTRYSRYHSQQQPRHAGVDGAVVADQRHAPDLNVAEHDVPVSLAAAVELAADAYSEEAANLHEDADWRLKLLGMPQLKVERQSRTVRGAGNQTLDFTQLVDVAEVLRPVYIQPHPLKANVSILNPYVA